MHSHLRPRIRQFALEERRQRVCEMYCGGKSQWEIAGILGVNQGTISRDLDFLRREWQSHRGDVLDARVAEELAKIDNLERIAWAGWNESCQDYEARSVRQVGTETIEEYVRRKRFGDPRFLKVISGCIELRLRLLCPFRARTVHVSATVETMDELSDAERQAALERILAEMGVKLVAPADSAPPQESITPAIDAAEPPLP